MTNPISHSGSTIFVPKVNSRPAIMDKLKELNIYCLKIKKQNKNWHPDSLYYYLSISIYDFLPPEYWDYYFLDKLDLQIIEAMMENAEISYAELGKKLFVSGGTIHVRIKKCFYKTCTWKFIC